MRQRRRYKVLDVADVERLWDENAPSCIARVTTASCVTPVTTITGIEASMAFRRSRTSTPLTPGMLRSRSTTSGCASLAASSAAVPSVAISTVLCREMQSRRNSATASPSSAIRTRPRRYIDAIPAVRSADHDSGRLRGKMTGEGRSELQLPGGVRPD